MLSRFHLRDRIFEHIYHSKNSISALDQMQKKGFRNDYIPLALAGLASRPNRVLLLYAFYMPDTLFCDLGRNGVG